MVRWQEVKAQTQELSVSNVSCETPGSDSEVLGTTYGMNM